MSDTLPTTEEMRRWIGREVAYEGRVCRIVELLEDQGALVVECTGDERTIQANQYGDATRRVPRTLTIPLTDEDGRPTPQFGLLRRLIETA